MIKYHITIGRSKAYAEYLGKEMKVLKDSVIDKEVKASLKQRDERQRLIDKYTTYTNGQLILTEDLVFKTPSAAAVFCTGRSSNGWLEWRDDEEKTLDSIVRR